MSKTFPSFLQPTGHLANTAFKAPALWFFHPRDPEITIPAYFAELAPTLVKQSLEDFKTMIDKKGKGIPTITLSDGEVLKMGYSYTFNGWGLHNDTLVVMCERQYAQWLYQLEMLFTNKEEFEKRLKQEMKDVKEWPDRAEIRVAQKEEREEWDVLDQKILHWLLTQGPAKAGQRFCDIGDTT